MTFLVSSTHANAEYGLQVRRALFLHSQMVWLSPRASTTTRHELPDEGLNASVAIMRQGCSEKENEHALHTRLFSSRFPEFNACANYAYKQGLPREL